MSKLRWSPDGGRLLVAATDSSFQVRAVHLATQSSMQHAPIVLRRQHADHCVEAAACWSLC